MKILIKAKSCSKLEYVKKIKGNEFLVAVKEIPEKGKANQAIIKAIADFFKINVSSIILISGHSSRKKIFEVPLSLKEIEKICEDSAQIKLF